MPIGRRKTESYFLPEQLDSSCHVEVASCQRVPNSVEYGLRPENSLRAGVVHVAAFRRLSSMPQRHSRETHP